MISIIIPCYNEENIIKDSIQRIYNYFENKNYVFELVVINNASTDNTLELLNEISNTRQVNILNENKKGKGNAIKLGLLNTKYDKVLILDADLSTDITELKIDWLDLKNTLLIGSRFLGEEIASPKIRRVSGFVLNYIIRLLFDIKYRDTQCGFKFLAYEDIGSLANKLSIEGFMYDLDLITLCKKMDLDVKEIPIRYVFNEHSSVSLIKDPMVMLFEMFKIRKKLIT
jgi:glycosyltransferase involved in cell wall biosynthesis